MWGRLCLLRASRGAAVKVVEEQRRKGRIICWRLCREFLFVVPGIPLLQSLVGGRDRGAAVAVPRAKMTHLMALPRSTLHGR